LVGGEGRCGDTVCACGLLFDAGPGRLLLGACDDAPPETSIFILLAARSGSLAPPAPCVNPDLFGATPLRPMLAAPGGLVGAMAPFGIGLSVEAFVRGNPWLWYALPGNGGYGDTCACGAREVVGKGTFVLMLGAAVAMGNEESGSSSLPSASSSLVRSTTECRQSLRMLDILPMILDLRVIGRLQRNASMKYLTYLIAVITGKVRHVHGSDGKCRVERSRTA
jgi:hypothetical protein